jgi:hypothetical protein
VADALDARHDVQISDIDTLDVTDLDAVVAGFRQDVARKNHDPERSQ